MDGSTTSTLAPHASQMMVVVALPVEDLVAQDPIAEIHDLGQSGTGQQAQGAVDGGLPDGRVAPPDLLVELLGGDMPLPGKEYLQNPAALRGHLEFLPSDEFRENNVGILHGALTLMLLLS